MLEHGKLGDSTRVFRNVLVPKATGATDMFEIDALMLHEKGIFVFESKNFSGWIFGSEDQQQWTCSLAGGHKERFYSPILQNRSHVKALAAHLGLPETAFRSYIVFSERCELKSVPANTQEYLICQRQHLLKLLRSDLGSRERVSDAEELERIRASLEALAGASTAEAREVYVRQAQRVKAGEVCPWCGRELVKRQGPYGEFMGCSGYPECRFTRKG